MPQKPARSFLSLSDALWTLFELSPGKSGAAESVFMLRVDKERKLFGVVCAAPDDSPPFRFQVNDRPAAPRFSRSFSLAIGREGVVSIHILWFAFDASFRSFRVQGADGSARPVVLAGTPLPCLDAAALQACTPMPDRPVWLALLSRLLRLTGVPRLIKRLGRKDFAGCWIFADRGFLADDNAEHLYRWVKRHHPERRIVFALHRRSPDWPRLEREGFTLVDIAGPRYLLACFNCEWLISSQRADYIAKHYWRRWHADVFRYRFCFLQHGITMNYLPRLNSPHADIMVSSTTREYEALSSDPRFAYAYSGRETRLTGLPRHDALLRKASEHPNPATVLIMPTWRHTLAGAQASDGQFTYTDEVADTEFFRRWQAVLRAEPLHRAAATYGYRLLFYPHPHLRPQVHHFRTKGVAVASESGGSLQDILADTALLITDYSSVAMETALLRRPVLYFQFDRERFFNSDHEQGRGRGYFDYERDGFGEVVTEERDLCDLAETYMEKRCRMKDVYRKRADAFFPFTDRESCRRVYETLCETD